MWSFWNSSKVGWELWLAVFTTLHYIGTSSLDFGRQLEFQNGRQGEFAKSLSSYEICIPSKVTEQGDHLSHSLRHFFPVDSVSDRRRRRDTTSFLSSSDDDAVHYKVNVEGRDLHFQLSANDRLFAPGLVVEHRKSDQRNLTGIRGRSLNNNRCHFTGQIKGHPESAAAIATCHGLHGFFRLEEKEYFIEPVKGHDPSVDKGHPHLIYKKSSLPIELHLPINNHEESKRHGREEHGDCGVNDVLHEKTQEERNRSDKGKKSRRKRSVSLERNVETLVVVDQAMMEYYKNEDIENYVLTVMNMVSTMFHDSSIGNAINIVLVRIIYLEHEETDLKVVHHADLTLSSFCRWQMTINPKDENHPNHHDVAILLTRVNICSRMNEPCSTLGLAQVSGLCQPHRSCNINEDTGLALAFTVAHELGHNFGMKHDTPENGCDMSVEETQYVMSPQLMAEASPLVWSNCSRHAITVFLDRDWGHCLDDIPTEHDFKFPILPPGVMYDIDHQCRLQYGPDAEYCDGIDDLCTTVWCRVDRKCLTRLEAAAEGTLCGDNEWCFGGRCIAIGETPLAIDSHWGEWSAWSECTRTCGAGVSYSERLCNNPPPSHGGKYCLGERRRYRICNTDSCPEGSPSFREKQCAEFNNIPYKGQKYQWEPEIALATPCQLHCKPKGQQPFVVVVMMKDMVKDGTPCKVGRNDMCISGRCRMVGCDWVIESDAKEDRCGVCHGDGTSCKTVQNSFYKESGLGYVEAAVIPEGARNIRIEEVAEAKNYLAIRNRMGHYYLNGNFYIQWTGDYAAAGSVLQYRRHGNRESLVVPGPIKEPLHVMLLFQSQNPGITFEYTVPDENMTDTKIREFHWKYSDWTHCTMSCGGGRQISEVVCFEKEAGIVDDIYCNASSKPDDMHKPCNDHMCPARWWTGPWQHCSVTCGDGGTQKRTVLCVRQLGADEQIALEDWECAGLQKPPEVAQCKKKDPCLVEDTQWQTGPWIGKCSPEEMCGTQKRVVSCLNPSGRCNMDTKPSSEQPCPGNACGHWRVSEWSKCSRSCGIGEHTRIVECVAGKACRQDQKPAIKEKCNRHECSQTGSYYNRFQFENHALHQPEVLIRTMVPVHAETTFAPEEIEDHDENKLLQDASVPKEEDQKQEKKSRETVTQVFYSSDQEDASYSLSHVITTPSTSDFRWMSLFWSECSKPCGNGFRTRGILCIRITSKEKVSEEHCHDQPKPMHRDGCQIRECSQWTTSPWQKCSVSCGNGVQARSISCPLSESCDSDERPEETKICNAGQCTEWITDQWQECSVTCGGGKQQRRVRCIDQATQQDALGCEESSQPPSEQLCNTHKCSRDPDNVVDGRHLACNENSISDGMCRTLRQMGKCAQEYVYRKCCKTCRLSTSISTAEDTTRQPSRA